MSNRLRRLRPRLLLHNIAYSHLTFYGEFFIYSNITYDALSQLTSISHQLASTTISYNYSYDAVGNRTSMADSSGTHNYTYDVINRLISAAHPLPELPTESFGYDGVGNRVNAGSFVYDDANRLLQDAEYTYSYDNNGNMVSKTEKTTGAITTYTYNPENQLIRVDSPDGTSASYRYDGLGRRIEKNLNGNITQYYYDNEDIILETDQDQNILAHYTHGPGIDEPLIMERDGESYYYLADGLGSITTITDSSQNTINSYTYDSFGSIIHSTGSLINPYTYTGREYDSEIGLYYYRARYYNPYIGRFLQEDPIGFWGGVNFYTYCDNNPLNWIDPWGLCAGNAWQILEDWLVPTVYADEILDEQLREAIPGLIGSLLPGAAGVAASGVAPFIKAPDGAPQSAGGSETIIPYNPNVEKWNIQLEREIRRKYFIEYNRGKKVR